MHMCSVTKKKKCSGRKVTIQGVEYLHSVNVFEFYFYFLKMDVDMGSQNAALTFD